MVWLTFDLLVGGHLVNKRPHKNSVNKSSQTKKKHRGGWACWQGVKPMYKFAYFVQENPTSVKDASRYVCNHESWQIFTEHPVHPLGNADKGI